MEENFKQSEKQSKKQSKREDLFNKFVRHYLTIKTGEIPNIKKVYEAFKDYQQKEGIEIEDLLKDLQKILRVFLPDCIQKRSR